MPKDGSELSLADVEFLRTVRDINANPEEYENTDTGVKPANISSLKSVLLDGSGTLDDWTEGKLDYRMREGKRGWLESDDGSFNMVVLHQGKSDPTAPSGYIVRSVELTERGKRKVAKAEEEWGFESSPSTAKETDSGALRVEVDQHSDQIAELQESLATIEEQLEQMNEYLEYIRDNKAGALDNETADHLEMVFDLNLRHERLLQMVMDVDTDPLKKGTDPSDRDIRAVQEDIASWVESATGEQPVGQTGGQE
jgi:archaellum component FlaC